MPNLQALFFSVQELFPLDTIILYITVNTCNELANIQLDQNMV